MNVYAFAAKPKEGFLHWTTVEAETEAEAIKKWRERNPQYRNNHWQPYAGPLLEKTNVG